MKSTRLAAIIALAGLCAFTAAACEDAKAPEYPKRTPTRGTAVLPPTPDLDPTMPPVHYDDDAYSVHGVHERGAKLPRDPINVRGYVAALHRCPDGAKRCNPAPYLQLTDAKSLQGRRLLIGGVLGKEHADLKIGSRITLRGRFMTRSADGLYFAPSGLLLLLTPEQVAEEAKKAAAAEKAAKK